MGVDSCSVTTSIRGVRARLGGEGVPSYLWHSYAIHGWRH